MMRNAERRRRKPLCAAAQGRAESIETQRRCISTFIRDLKRIHGHLASTAYPILEAIGELGESRLRQREGDSGIEAMKPRSAPN